MADRIVSAPPWTWPDTMDALVAAPKHHTLMLENDRVRVIDTHIAPGEAVPLHTHRWPGVLHILSWSDFVRRDENGEVLLDTRKTMSRPPVIMWTAPLPPHTLENVGMADIHILSFEIKDLDFAIPASPPQADIQT